MFHSAYSAEVAEYWNCKYHEGCKGTLSFFYFNGDFCSLFQTHVGVNQMQGRKMLIVMDDQEYLREAGAGPACESLSLMILFLNESSIFLAHTS